VTALRYRGQGWPGRFRVTAITPGKDASLPYADAWERLYAYVPLRCRLCCHGLGPLGDISCGDAWHNSTREKDEGQSVVLVRTERGRRLVQGAIEAGYVNLDPCDPALVIAGQANLLIKRNHLFGRLLALKLGLIPVPSFRGFRLFKAWRTLPLREKWQSVWGTLNRIVKRQLWRPLWFEACKDTRDTNGRVVL
jgi:coenzyme F420 hydrogenase subunit beta